MSDPNYWELLDDAILLATEKHHGQIDKSGRPYILHPMRVMQSFKDPVLKIMAVLHDIIEDTDVTVDDLIEKFGHSIADHVYYLSKLKSQTLEEYLDGIKLWDYCLKVKIKDIEDNMSPFRLAKLPKEVAERMVKKYLYCLDYLGNHDS